MNLRVTLLCCLLLGVRSLDWNRERCEKCVERQNKLYCVGELSSDFAAIELCLPSCPKRARSFSTVEDCRITTEEKNKSDGSDENQGFLEDTTTQVAIAAGAGFLLITLCLCLCGRLRRSNRSVSEAKSPADKMQLQEVQNATVKTTPQQSKQKRQDTTSFSTATANPPEHNTSYVSKTNHHPTVISVATPNPPAFNPSFVSTTPANPSHLMPLASPGTSATKKKRRNPHIPWPESHQESV